MNLTRTKSNGTHRLGLPLSSNVRMLSRVVRSGAMLSVLKGFGGIFLLLSDLNIIFDLHLLSNDTIFLMYMYHFILFTYMRYAYNNYMIVHGNKKNYINDTAINVIVCNPKAYTPFIEKKIVFYSLVIQDEFVQIFFIHFFLFPSCVVSLNLITNLH